MDTVFSMKQFDDLIAIRSSKGRVVGFHTKNLEIARLSEQAWEQGLKLNEVRAWNSQQKSKELSSFETDDNCEESADETQKQSHKPLNYQVRALSINVTQICNLHCTYCAAGGDGSYGDPVKKIAVDKTLPQIQFFMGKLSPGDEFRLTFLGGEPLLYPEAILLLAEYAQEFAAVRQIKTQFVVVTNGTQFTERNIEILDKIKANITISLDGPPEVNDLLRPNRAGFGVTHSIIAGLRSLLDQKKQSKKNIGSVGISGVFGSKNMNLEKAYRFYSEFPVQWFDFTYDHLETREQVNWEFTQELLHVGALAFAKGGEQELRRIKIFDQYFQVFDSQKINNNYCGAGKTFLMVDARNQIYTCPWVVGDSKEVVGQGTTLFQEKLSGYSQDLIVQNNCQNCWASAICGGGCMYIHKNKTGDKHQVDPNFCSRTRELIATSLLYYEESRGLSTQVQEVIEGEQILG